MNVTTRLNLLGLTAICLGGCVTGPLLEVDVLYTNADIYAPDSASKPKSTAFGVTAGKVVLVTDKSAASKVNAAQIVDLGGRQVLPGFVDSHAHPGLVALIGDLPRQARDTHRQHWPQYVAELGGARDVWR